MTRPQFLHTIRPKMLFLIDSLGALVSALLLGGVLVHWEYVFGMPPRILYVLSCIACLFCLCSFVGFLGIPAHKSLYLKRIALANLLYCGLTTALMIQARSTLTAWGVLYFVLEMLVVILLSSLELKTATALQRQKRR